MQNKSSFINVEATNKFQRNIRILANKNRNIRNDIEPVIKQLESGELPGYLVPGLGYTIFKSRVKNSDIQNGKNGEYQIIYYLKTATNIILVTIHNTMKSFSNYS
ncbi:MAG: type II toxin-antitoxin system RelE/ParE family toxin [Cyanobacteria bacterium J06639_18]